MDIDFDLPFHFPVIEDVMASPSTRPEIVEGVPVPNEKDVDLPVLAWVDPRRAVGGRVVLFQVLADGGVEGLEGLWIGGVGNVGLGV